MEKIFIYVFIYFIIYFILISFFKFLFFYPDLYFLPYVFLIFFFSCASALLSYYYPQQQVLNFLGKNTSCFFNRKSTCENSDKYRVIKSLITDHSRRQWDSDAIFYFYHKIPAVASCKTLHKESYKACTLSLVWEPNRDFYNNAVYVILWNSKDSVLFFTTLLPC